MKSSLELLMMHQSCEMTGTEKFAASTIFHTSVFLLSCSPFHPEIQCEIQPVHHSMFSSLLSSSYMSFDSFPRLDPPPPSGKKRVPRALKTTQDMMISSDPVVSSPDHAEPSPVASPDKTLPDTKEELKVDEEELQDAEETEAQDSTQDQTEEKKVEDEKVDGTAGGGEADVEDGGSEGGEGKHQLQLQLSVPDLINKDPPQPESRDKSNEVWVKVSDSRLASTPCSGKTACRISLGEEVLLGNGAPCSKGNAVSPEEFEPHPDLLSFE